MQLSDLIIAAQNRELVIENWQTWRDYLSGLLCEFTPVDCAFIAGAWSTAMAYAFAGGYQAALRALYPEANPHKIYAFAVTEKGGNTPKAIQTTLTRSGNQFLLKGEKTFITGIDAAETVLVAAWDAYHIDAIGSDRKNIKMVMLERESEGITFSKHAPMAFLSELSHGSMQLSNVRVEDEKILPGDGYDDYVKPFRTIEDIHVTSSLVGYLFSMGLKHRWPDTLQQQLFSILGQLRSIATLSAKDAGVHIALAGALDCFQLQLKRVGFQIELLPEETKLKWQQDKKIFGLASEARNKRTENAWQLLRLN